MKPISLILMCILLSCSPTKKGRVGSEALSIFERVTILEEQVAEMTVTLSLSQFEIDSMKNVSLRSTQTFKVLRVTDSLIVGKDTTRRGGPTDTLVVDPNNVDTSGLQIERIKNK